VKAAPVRYPVVAATFRDVPAACKCDWDWLHAGEPWFLRLRSRHCHLHPQPIAPDHPQAAERRRAMDRAERHRAGIGSRRPAVSVA
jgi:hypothetical protein